MPYFGREEIQYLARFISILRYGMSDVSTYDEAGAEAGQLLVFTEYAS